MLIAIEDWMFYGAIAISVLLFLISIGLYTAIRNNAPDAMMHWKAARAGKVICRVHYKGRACKDYIAEKEIGTPYWNVPTLGIKFKPGSEDIEFIEGTIPCCNYYENTPEAMKINQVVAYSQLKDYFRKIGIPIDGVENVALYISAELEKMPDAKRAMMTAKVNSDETKKYLDKYLRTVKAHETELRSLKLESGVFTWQTCMKALDDTIAYTSSNIAHMKETIRAALLRQEENKRKDLVMYAIIAVILSIAGIILLFGIKSFTGG